jgi:ribonuclease-3
MNFDQISKFLVDDFFVFNKEYTHDDLYKVFCENFSIELLEDLQVTPNLFKAFTHKSFEHETNGLFPNNEKLEFLGDAVLELIISDLLFKIFKNKNEGELSKLRSAIVNENTLREIAKFLNLGKFILLGKGEYKEKGHEKDSLLSDTFEAFLGAYYLDHGIEQTTMLMTTLIHNLKERYGKDYLNESILFQFDAKSTLQEIVMKKFKTTPKYESLEITENGEKLFKVNVIIDNKSLGEVVHRSKKKAMQLVAKNVLENKLV